MMRKTFVLLVVGLFMVCSVTAEAVAKDLKVGYVDMQKIFTEYKQTKEAEAKLESKGKTKADERNKMVEEIRRLKDEMELLSSKGKEGKQEQIDEKIKELQDFDRLARNELMREREEMIRDISKDIDKVIDSYGKKEGYDLILNDRVLLFGNDTLNVTDDIIKALNK